jgi:hypothetical protein
MFTMKVLVISQEFRDHVAAQIIEDLMVEALAHSTWRENNIRAYDELLEYKEDMIQTVKTTIRLAEGI